VKLTKVKYLQVTEEESTPDAISSKVLVYKDVPIVTVLSTGQGPNLTVGANVNIKLYEWKIAADTESINATGTQFVIELKGPGTAATTTLSGLKVLKNDVSITDKVEITTSTALTAALSTNTITITPKSAYSDVFEVDTTGITLKLVANVDGSENGYVKARLLGDDDTETVGTAKFVWYDGIKQATGYLVKGLPAVGTDTYLIKVVK